LGRLLKDQHTQLSKLQSTKSFNLSKFISKLNFEDAYNSNDVTLKVDQKQ